MTSETDGQDKPRTMAEHLAANVRRLREQQRISATDFAERLAKLGAPMGRMGVQRLEKGERRVELTELAALATALDVPPIVLILPLGEVPTVELLPGKVVDTWSAAQWFSGRRRLDNEGKPRDEWSHVRIYEEHERLVNELGYAHAEAELWPAEEGDPERKAARRRARVALRDLSLTRAAMQRRGMQLPAVDEDIAALLERQRFTWVPVDDWLALPAEERRKLRPVTFNDDNDDQDETEE
ncbi:helix-turn-helix domain-containing protein [Dactylosporangium sp. CA-139066]|uniref:helix-turn-helix domain-containing protein n=1 Tax=Dactylosporangium sp. CA-139066 TaxID=3239930 RepID=UPI003D9326B3